MNIMLPPLPDREALLGFRVSLSVLAGVGVGVGALLSGQGTPVGALALSLGTAVLLFGMSRSRERAVERVYVRWNRATRIYAEHSRRWIAALWYWSVFTVVSRTGGNGLVLGESDWRPRDTLSGRAYADPGGAPTDLEGTGGLRDLARWAVRTGRPWTLVLAPLFGLLRALETRAGGKPPADIYTLY